MPRWRSARPSPAPASSEPIHARAARACGRHPVVGVARVHPRVGAPRRRERARRRDARTTAADEPLGSADGGRRRPHLHAESSSSAAHRGGALQPAERVDLPEAFGARRGRVRRRSQASAPRTPRPSAAVPFVYRFYPTVQRRAGARRIRRRGAIRRSTAGTSRTGSCAPKTTTGTSTPTRAGRRRPSPTSGRTRATSGSPSRATGINRACTRGRLYLGSRQRPRARKIKNIYIYIYKKKKKKRTPPSCSSRTGQGGLGSAVISQISAGRKNRLLLELDVAGRRSPSTRRSRSRCGWAAADSVTARSRDPATLDPPAAPSRGASRRVTPRATATASTCSWPTHPRRSSRARPDGLPVFKDGLRAAAITEAVIESARGERWVDVAPVKVSA